jgi:BlaI family penicillinase repressor
MGVVVSTTLIVDACTEVVDRMPGPRLTKLEMLIMETLWTRGEASIREVQEAFPEKGRPAYTTVQTTMYRLETKGVLHRVRKVGNFHIFAAKVERSAAQRRLVDDLLALFGGRTQPVMAHLIESGKLTMEDVKAAEKELKRLERG